MTIGGYDAGYEAGIDGLIHDIYDLQDENAKLRELVRDMWHEGAFEPGACCFAETSGLERRTRELGIEVEE